MNAGFTRERVGVLVVLVLAMTAPADSIAFGTSGMPSLRRQRESRYEFKGVVKSVDKAHKRATIKHEKVGDLMDPMTMPFLIKDEKALNQMEPGDQIKAVLVSTDDGRQWLENITIIAKAHPSRESSNDADIDLEARPIWMMGVAANNSAPIEVGPPSRFEDTSGLYTCSMHLDIRANAPGKCPKCGMELVSIEPLIPDEFDLTMDVQPRTPRPGQKTHLRFLLRNPRTGEPVKKFAMMHDKFFHLFVVSQDLNEFHHIHPQAQADGSFIIDVVLSRPGLYKIYSDVYPMEGAPQLIQTHLATAGWSGDLMRGQARLVPDATLRKTATAVTVTRDNIENLGVNTSALTAEAAGDLTAELKVDPGKITSGQPARLNYRLTDAKTGRPVNDLAPYLGAWGHMLILSEDQTVVLHSHPEQKIDLENSEATQRGGPELTFEVLFPSPGNYRVWAQFLRGNRLSTVAFDLKIMQLE
jgi:Cu/Ag efflux protein CusF